MESIIDGSMPCPESLTVSSMYGPGWRPLRDAEDSPASSISASATSKTPPWSSHRMRGVGAQVHQHLVYLGRIGQYRPFALYIGLYLYRRGQGRPQNAHGLLHDGPRLQHDLLLFGPSAECENLPDQFLCPVGRLEYFVEFGMNRPSRIGIIYCQLVSR